MVLPERQEAPDPEKRRYLRGDEFLMKNKFKKNKAKIGRGKTNEYRSKSPRKAKRPNSREDDGMVSDVC